MVSRWIERDEKRKGNEKRKKEKRNSPCQDVEYAREVYWLHGSLAPWLAGSLAPWLYSSLARRLPLRSSLTQNLSQKVFKGEGNPAVAIIIVALKDVGHALEADAALDEQIEADGAARRGADDEAAIVAAHGAAGLGGVDAEQHIDEAVAEAVAKGHQRLLVLGQRDVARAVRVESVKERAPGREEGPEAAELRVGDRAAAVRVEHADHHAHRVWVEGRPVAIDERR
jgi:hypothetical protein